MPLASAIATRPHRAREAPQIKRVANQPVAPHANDVSHAKGACTCGGGCPRCAQKIAMQTKLTLGASNDPLELEADWVAKQVMATPATSAIGSVPLRIQRYAMQGSEQAASVPASVERVLASVGRPLDPAVRQEMGLRFGHDFSHVRIHSDTTAEQSALNVNANAYTVGHDIVFGAGQYAPTTPAGRRLLAHELTHVVQQSGVGGAGCVRRDLAIEPAVGSPVERGLTEEDILAAIRFNDREFEDPYSLAVIRDVIGVSRFPAVSDRDLAEGVARWQAAHGVSQDGKLGAVTVTYVIEELQAEGNDADASLLMLEFPRGTFLDVDTSFCACTSELERERDDSTFFIGEYTACGADPANTTGAQVEACIERRAAARGATLVTAGTTDSSGTVRVARVAGPCGPLIERLTLAHEQIHSVHTRELQQIHGRDTRAFNRAFNDAADWVSDEINSRRTDVAVAEWALGILGRICP